jgi:hypothetical protein
MFTMRENVGGAGRGWTQKQQIQKHNMKNNDNSSNNNNISIVYC